MIYSDFYLKKKQNIPTIAALFAIIFVVFVISRFFLTTPISSRASPDISSSLVATNITSNQSTIFFKSNKPEISWILYGVQPDKLDKTALDARDTANNKKTRLTHYIQLKDLSADVTYYYKVISDNKLISKPDGSAFHFITVSREQQTSNLRPAYGKVVSKSGTSVEGAIVVLTASHIIPLSTITKAGGDFVIPLTQVFDETTHKLRVLSDRDQIKIKIFDESSENTTISTNLLNINPIPEVVKIGESYNFLQNEKVLSASSSQSSQQGEMKADQYGILFPRDNALIPAISPLIKGKAYPGSDAKLTLQNTKGNVQSQFVKVAKDGSWKLLLTTALRPGTYSILFDGKDNQGKTFTQKRTFTIIKSGESVLGESTPEAVPTSTVTPSTPTPTISTSSPTATPGAISPSPVITEAPTGAPPIISPTTALPQSGNTTAQTIVSSTALILGGIGLLLFAF